MTDMKLTYKYAENRLLLAPENFVVSFVSDTEILYKAERRR